MMDNQPCKFFLSVGGCKYGHNCLYSHQNDNKITVNANQQPCIRPPLPLHQQVKESDNSRLNSKLPATWNFENNGWDHSINDDEIFFYGSRGSHSTGFAEERKNFAEVLKANLPQSGDMPSFPSSQPPSRSELAPCRFYLGGYCKFGDHCKYDHAIIHDVVLPLCDEEFQSIDCGICIEASSSSLFGVLSHCDCKFCLPCIREWRKEGVNVSHDTEQVRLCPLCRKESFFVIPSKRFVVGTDKQKLVDTYLCSVSTKPCKYYSAGEDCPFGTSCFYMHEPDGSKCSSARYLYRNEGEVIAPTAITLWDFVKTRQVPS